MGPRTVYCARCTDLVLYNNCFFLFTHYSKQFVFGIFRCSLFTKIKMTINLIESRNSPKKKKQISQYPNHSNENASGPEEY